MQVLDRLKRSDYAVLDAAVKFLLPDIVAEGVQQVALELLEVPHVSFDVMCGLNLLAVLCDAVIGQVGVPVRDLIEVEVGRREANIGLCVDPDRQRIPVGDKDPLADVELTALDEQRVLDVLLADVRLPLRLITDRLLARPVADHV